MAEQPKRIQTDYGIPDLRRHWMETAEKEHPERESWTTPAMEKTHDLVSELQRDGWRSVDYCPKDGSVFLAWSPLVRGPYRCRYDGEWPNGRWWAMMDGDLWPDRPVLFKLLDQ